MATHRYDVQCANMLALHQLLQSRLSDAYAPENNLGGPDYFFLRGIDGHKQEVLPRGAFLGHARSAHSSIRPAC
jgi:exodeoxyribonuclease V beta subunit